MTTEQTPSTTPLSPEDLTFWYADQPRQRTTMAMLMLLDRRPAPERLRAAAGRACELVPRLRQRVVDAPLDLALPRWEEDPTFDLDFHIRRYAQSLEGEAEEPLDALFRTIGPIYERPFDDSRPLWEMIEIDRPGDRSAIFFRLHHAMADGVGGNAILAALTDADRQGEPLPPPAWKPPGAWPEPHPVERLAQALRQRVGEETDRAWAFGGALWGAVRDPGSLGRAAAAVSQLLDDARFASHSPLSQFGRSRHLSGFVVDFEPLRVAKRQLGGKMIDLLLAGVAGAMGRWHHAHGHGDVEELATLVPINLRPPEEQGLAAAMGNRATAVIVRLPLKIDDVRERFAEIHRRVEARKTHPSTQLAPAAAGLLAGVPRWLFRAISVQASSGVDLIVTNVPGVPQPRYLAGSEITAAFPFAPNGPRTPVSLALYGYHGGLHVGIDADGTAMADLEAFRELLRESFAEVASAGRSRSTRRARKTKHGERRRTKEGRAQGGSQDQGEPESRSGQS